LPTKKKRQKNLAAWIDRFDGALAGRNYSPDTRRCYRLRLTLFQRWIETHGVQHCEAVTPEHLGEYQAHLASDYRKERGGRLSTGTQAQRLAPIKALFLWLYQRGQLERNPASELSLPVKPKTLPRDVPTVRETGGVLRALLASGQKHALRDAAIIATLYATGCRKMELARLRLQDVDFQTREVRIEKAKNREGRITFIAAWAVPLLQHYIATGRKPHRMKSDALFLTEAGGGFSDVRLGVVVAEAFAKLPDKHVTCHSLRHAFCIALLRGGAGVRVIAELAGHRRLKSTTIYTRLELSDLRKVHARAFME
jgi:integrase/recombinase XerD